MNYAMLVYILGSVLKIEGVFLTLPTVIAFFYGERSLVAFLITMILCLAIGIGATWKKPDNTVFYSKEGFLAVSLSWVFLSIFGCIPFVLSGDIPSFTDALFETISGFTTTGASILSDVEALSKSGLFWRSFTHWLGGMGVLVFILAVLPMAGGRHMYLMKAESPGPSVSKLVPRVKQTARILYAIYFVMTVAQIILLLLGGMPVFDAVTLSMGTAGTGGFGVRNDSVGSYTPYMRNVITVFMILFGINFNIYYLFLCKKWRQALRSEEVRMYFGIIILAIVMITYNVRNFFPNGREAFQQAAFQVASIMTSTGYSTVDFGKWPILSQTILLMLMFVGACAGSTGGGIKVSRVLLMIKSVKRELHIIVHPRARMKIKMDDRVVEGDTLRSVNVFIGCYLLIFAVSLLCISVDDFDFTTNFTAITATINNIGPGLGQVGPAGNFGGYSGFSKYVIMFDMLVGRLEIFPMMALFLPQTWRRR
ncbi:MAG: TrkH family potassium uptake protein [Lachnospiraceae bacterium]|nr:TrkH family potassium uptake protein [Lachnospiraceae bacterium]